MRTQEQRIADARLNVQIAATRFHIAKNKLAAKALDWAKMNDHEFATCEERAELTAEYESAEAAYEAWLDMLVLVAKG